MASSPEPGVGSRVEVLVLGPLEVRIDGVLTDPGGPRQRCVLAELVLAAPRVVPMAALIDACWPDNPPATARQQIQICISNLRQRLDLRDGASRIVTRTPGYALEIDAGQLDLARFSQAAADGRAELAAGRLAEADSSLSLALSLWRGENAFGGVESPRVEQAAVRLEEQRLGVLEDLVDVALKRGRQADVVHWLAAEVDRNPLREHLRELLMLCLVRLDRTADALSEYRRAREVTTEELGLEPSDRLQQLEQDILRGEVELEPALPGEPAPQIGQANQANQADQGEQADQRDQPDEEEAPLHRPQQLPAPLADFTGRSEEVGQMLAVLSAGESRPPVVVSGPAGVGKSALSLFVAHRVAAEFPDGQLFANLRGTSRPVGARSTLDMFLRALGVPVSAIPDGLDDRAALFRDRLAGRRVLIVLDDVESVQQVEALLPGAGECAVIFTSRRRMTAMPGIQRVGLEPFPTADALELLTRIVGPDRVEGAGQDVLDAQDLVRLCGHLPLAVRAAGARLASRPDWTVGDMVDRIEDAGRLEELSYDGLNVRSTLQLAYESLQPGAQVLLRRLALVQTPSFGSWVCAALLDGPLRQAQDALGELVEMHLLEVEAAVNGPGTRYRLPELVQLLAAERVAAEDPAHEREAALDRYFGVYVHLLEAAHGREYGGDYLILISGAGRDLLPETFVRRLLASPPGWLTAEREAIGAAVQQAATLGRARAAWGMAQAAVTLYEIYTYFDDWQTTHQAALSAAVQAGDRLGEAVLRYSLGSLSLFEQRFDAAGEPLAQALQIFAELGNQRGVAMVERNQAFADRVFGRYDQARLRLGRALATFRAVDDVVGQAHVLNSLAQIEMVFDHGPQALHLLEEATLLCGEVRNQRVGAQVAHRIGEVHLGQGRLDGAARSFGQVEEMAGETGDPIARIYALEGLGTVASRRQELGRARTLLVTAERLAAEHGETRARSRLLTLLSTVSMAEGRTRVARAEAGRALEVAARSGSPVDVAGVELQLGRVQLAAGEPGVAARTWQAALNRIEAARAADAEAGGLTLGALDDLSAELTSALRASAVPAGSPGEVQGTAPAAPAASAPDGVARL